MITIDSKSSLDLCYRIDSSFNLSFHSAGLIKDKSCWAHRMRIIDFYEIIVVYDGELCIKKNDEKHRLSQGDLLILTPYTKTEGFDSPAKNTTFAWIRFFTSKLSGFGVTRDTVNISENKTIKHIIDDIIALQTSPYYPKFLPELLCCTLLSQIGMVQNSGPNTDTAHKIAAWLAENPSAGIEQVSEHFGYNKDYIGKLFKKTFGITIKQYTVSQRLKNAKLLLTASSYPIKNISEMLEFENENLFVKFFKYHEGISPKKYRNTYSK